MSRRPSHLEFDLFKRQVRLEYDGLHISVYDGRKLIVVGRRERHNADPSRETVVLMEMGEEGPERSAFRELQGDDGLLTLFGLIDSYMSGKRRDAENSTRKKRKADSSK